MFGNNSAPDDWTLKNLADTASSEPNSFTDGDWIEERYMDSEGIRVVQTGNIGIGRFVDRPDFHKFISERSFTELNCKWVHPGDILICRLGEPVGRCCIVPETIGNCVTAVDCTIYRPSSNEVNPSFILHALNFEAHLREVSRYSSGTTRLRISRTNLGKVSIHLPPQSEQRRIAFVLDTIDELIAKTEAVIAKLKQVRAGLLHDLLTRGLDENGELRDPIAHPEQFKDSPLGRIPKEWEVLELARLCSHIGSGLTPRGGEDVYTSEGIIFIRSQNVTFEGLLLEDVAYIPERIHNEMLRSQVFPHDVLFNITGASIGRCCYFPEGLGKANVNQHVCVLRVPNAGKAEAVFLAAILASPIGQKQMEALNTFGNRQGLNYQQLGSFKVPWSRADERRHIAERALHFLEQLKSEESSLSKLRLLKSGLMSDLLTGRVRVPAGVVAEVAAKVGEENVKHD